MSFGVADTLVAERLIDDIKTTGIGVDNGSIHILKANIVQQQHNVASSNDDNDDNLNAGDQASFLASIKARVMVAQVVEVTLQQVCF